MMFSRFSEKLILILAITLALIGAASAADQGYRVIYRFKGGADGQDPVGIPAVDKNGNLFGVTYSGGSDNLGTLYELTAPRTRHEGWKETVLYEFPTGSEGGESVVFGPDGNLYGHSGLTIFEFERQNHRRKVGKYVLLYKLNGNTDGSSVTGLVFGPDGNLFGAAAYGGDTGCDRGYGCGTVFELLRPAKKGGKWHFKVLYIFTDKPDGALPVGGVIFSRRGNLFGPTWYGGIYGYGTVYRMVRPTKESKHWSGSVLYSFDERTGFGIPFGPVTFDNQHRQNLYGTAALGGGFGCGGVFELSPPAVKGSSWTYATLYAFTGGKDGCYGGGWADGNLVVDSNGNVYGTTPDGGDAEAGTLFRLSPPNGGGRWTETTLHQFGDKNGDGGVPYGVTWGKWGDLYGLTGEGGHCLGCGTVFELQP